jgi:hypothetical protein
MSTFRCLPTSTQRVVSLVHGFQAVASSLVKQATQIAIPFRRQMSAKILTFKPRPSDELPPEPEATTLNDLKTIHDMFEGLFDDDQKAQIRAELDALIADDDLI